MSAESATQLILPVGQFESGNENLHQDGIIFDDGSKYVEISGRLVSGIIARATNPDNIIDPCPRPESPFSDWAYGIWAENLDRVGEVALENGGPL